MIATILPSSTNFHAVGYNERKVAKGTARLIEMLNFGSIGTFGKPTPDELRQYLLEYSACNDRIKKAQFHLAISCKGKEMTEQELLDFAHKYLKEMGYMEPGQPILIYSHHDTANTHLHIVTSRVGPDGRKINDHHERRRSQEVIDRILGNDRQKKVEDDFNDALKYTFSTFAQFKAIMSTMGYETFEKNNTVYIKHGGKIRMTLPYVDFNDKYTYGKYDRSRAMQLRQIVKRFRDTSSNKEELKKELKTKMGIDMIFFGKADAPYGYMLVDHSTKAVFHGARILAMEELLDFATPEERFDRVESFIDNLFTINPKITQGEIFDKLRRQHAYIKKGVIYFDGQTRPLKQFMVDALARNSRLKWVESFNPVTEAERDFLCKAGKGADATLISLSESRSEQYNEIVNGLREMIENPEGNIDIRANLRERGFIIKRDGENMFAVNFNDRIIINLTEEGIDIRRLQKQERKQQRKPVLPSNIRKLRDAGGGSRSDNREWEVGNRGDYDRIDEGQSLKR